MSPLGFYRIDALTPEFRAHIRIVVQDRIANGSRRWTMRDLVHDIALQQNRPPSTVHSAIRELIEEGLLEYRYTYGQSYLAQSFRMPVELTSRFTVVPPGHGDAVSYPKIAITLAQGVSFGDGRHPTTRLALQALDQCWTYRQEGGQVWTPHSVDIGTGSGILAIAAAALGAARVTALDIDACSRSEARHNVRLNSNSLGVVEVDDRALESFDQPFDLVMANLRPPTLAGLARWVRDHLTSMGCMAVSGCREEEWGRLVAIYREQGLGLLWKNVLGGWAGGLLQIREESCSGRVAVNGE